MRTSSAARQFVTWAPFAVLLIVLLPVASAAQEPVKSFDQLNTRLKPGDTIWVTDAQGREIKGRITSLAPDTLGLDARGATTLPADQVRVVENRRHDSLKNGTLIGLVVGLGASWGVVAAICANEGCELDAGGAVLGSLIYGGIGAGIGAGVDAAIPGRRQIVYRAGTASPSAHLALAPVITPRTKGVAVAFSF